MHRICSSSLGKAAKVRGDDWSQTVLLEFDVKDSLGDFWLIWQDGVLLNESWHRVCAFVPRRNYKYDQRLSQPLRMG